MIDTQKAIGNLIKQVEIEKHYFNKANLRNATHIFINKNYLLDMVNTNLLRNTTDNEKFFLGLKVCWIEDKGFSVGTLIKFEEVSE